ncbi:MAG TPA: SH3-like domain-containing protein [Nevskiaceae bacterium]|nr:SH3-like domain-containing protein [Nevskiaceae bacterium]
MDGVHDLGGVNGFGRVEVEANEPVFHEDWESIGYALAFVGAGELKLFTIDEVRHAIERMEPRHYLASTYYERIVTGVAALFVEKGVLTQADLERRAGGRFPLAAAPGPGQKARTESKNFQVGDRVIVTGEHIRAHARMPKYVRGKTGTVLHRTTHLFPFAGSAGHGVEAKLEPTYNVRFDARDLWSDADPNASVVVDLWESYLDHAPEKSA